MSRLDKVEISAKRLRAQYPNDPDVQRVVRAAFDWVDMVRFARRKARRDNALRINALNADRVGDA